MANITSKCAEMHGVKMYSTVTVGTKWQVVIPSEVRADLNINPGDNLMVMTKNGIGIGMIKMDDLEQMMDYMKKEIEDWKSEKTTL